MGMTAASRMLGRIGEGLRRADPSLSSPELFEPGDAFYVEPGHVPVFEAGTEMVQFSPTAELKATDEAIRRYMEESA
jgi:hypothetical protein